MNMAQLLPDSNSTGEDNIRAKKLDNGVAEQLLSQLYFSLKLQKMGSSKLTSKQLQIIVPESGKLNISTQSKILLTNPHTIINHSHPCNMSINHIGILSDNFFNYCKMLLFLYCDVAFFLFDVQDENVAFGYWFVEIADFFDAP